MRKLVFLSIFIMFGFSVTELHAAAKEKASAKNFDPKLVASLQKLLDPNRFYPDLKNDPDTFVELPEMAGLGLAWSLVAYLTSISQALIPPWRQNIVSRTMRYSCTQE